MTAGDGAAAASSSRAADLLLKTQAIELLQARRSERQFCSGGTSLLHVHCTGSGTQEPSIASSACADSALLIMSRVVRNIRFVVPLPAPKHLCSKRRDQKCKTLWGGYADDPGTDGARHWAKWRGDRAEATGQRARPKADGQSCTLATPRGSSIRVPIGRLSPEAFSRGGGGVLGVVVPTGSPCVRPVLALSSLLIAHCRPLERGRSDISRTDGRTRRSAAACGRRR